MRRSRRDKKMANYVSAFDKFSEGISFEHILPPSLSYFFARKFIVHSFSNFTRVLPEKYIQRIISQIPSYVDLNCYILMLT